MTSYRRLFQMSIVYYVSVKTTIPMFTLDHKRQISNTKTALLLIHSHFDMDSTSICTKSLVSAFKSLYKRRGEDDSTDLVVVCEEKGDDLLVWEKEIPVHSFILKTR